MDFEELLVDEKINYLLNEINNILRKDNKCVMYEKGVIYFCINNEKKSSMFFGRCGFELEVINYLKDMLKKLDDERRDLF